MVRTVFFTLLLASGWAACGTGPTPSTPGSTAPAHPARPGPFTGTGLRMDGYYMATNGGVSYLVRFFPQGNAVLINGMGGSVGDLPAKLVADAQPDPIIGYYNVPVDVVGDSMFFTTTPRRGEIDYRGAAVHPDTLRFHRHSRITGRKEVMDYRFVPDRLQ